MVYLEQLVFRHRKKINAWYLSLTLEAGDYFFVVSISLCHVYLPGSLLVVLRGENSKNHTFPLSLSLSLSLFLFPVVPSSGDVGKLSSALLTTEGDPSLEQLVCSAEQRGRSSGGAREERAQTQEERMVLPRPKNVPLSSGTVLEDSQQDGSGGPTHSPLPFPLSSSSRRPFSASAAGLFPRAGQRGGEGTAAVEVSARAERSKRDVFTDDGDDDGVASVGRLVRR